jgi:undecaprenyl-diphosphatase
MSFLNFFNTGNEAIFSWLHGFVGKSGVIDAFAIFFATYLPYLVALGFFVLVFYQIGARRKWYLAVEGALAIILSCGIITTIIKFFYNHPRPFDVYKFTALIGEAGPSFPSGYATFFFALATVIFYVNRKWGFWYFLSAMVISVARVYVGVHWPLDIFGGLIVGVGSGMVVHWMLAETREKIPAHIPTNNNHNIYQEKPTPASIVVASKEDLVGENPNTATMAAAKIRMKRPRLTKPKATLAKTTNDTTNAPPSKPSQV